MEEWKLIILGVVGVVGGVILGWLIVLLGHIIVRFVPKIHD